jgi:hypothetical protein
VSVAKTALYTAPHVPCVAYRFLAVQAAKLEGGKRSSGLQKQQQQSWLGQGSFPSQKNLAMVCEAASAMQQACMPASAMNAEALKQQHEQELPGSILHFNWDQRQAARAAMNTLVQALADDPVNNYFSGSKRVRFVKDEVSFILGCYASWHPGQLAGHLQIACNECPVQSCNKLVHQHACVCIPLQLEPREPLLSCVCP